MDAVRVLHFVPSLSRSSGVMSVIMNYYRNIDRDKVQFDFIYFTRSDDTYKEEIKSYGGNTYLVPKPSLKPVFKAELLKTITSSKYIALHNHVVFLTSYLAPIAKKNDIKNVITHCHATMYSDKMINSIRNQLLCLGFKKHATHYFACSEAAGRFLYGKESMDAGKVVVINNAIDYEKFRFNEAIRNRVRCELGMKNHFVVGHVGQFRKNKNHTFLIKIFAALKEKGRHAKLILVGKGPLFEQIKREIKKLNINSDVLLLGKRNDVHELLQGMDIFVLPSFFEGLSVAGVEAQAAGLPCVISDTVTNEVNISDLVVFKSLNDSPVSWADAITEVGVNTSRHDTKNKFLNAGYNIKFQSQKLQEFYLSLN